MAYLQLGNDEEDPTGVPAAFIREVRDALAHLFEPAHLAGHPLRAILTRATHEGDPDVSLRDLLLDEIEALEPAGGYSEERAKRPYLVLLHRYVDGYETSEIIETLNISPRQFQREHQKGLQALAARLWERAERGAEPETDVEQSAAGSPLEEAVSSLGVSLEAMSVEALLESCESPARALCTRSGVTLEPPTIGLSLELLADRSLARQALLSGLSALIKAGADRVVMEVLPGRSRHVVCLGARLDDSYATEASLAPVLEVISTLMVAQGGGATHATDLAGRRVLALSFSTGAEATVLVVDDNEKMLQLYERTLALGGYTVVRALSAAEAEVQMAATHPDIIVLDVMMRDSDGWELLQRLRSQPLTAATPVLVSSVLDEPELAYALGAQAFLRKPVPAEELLTTLQALLAGSSLAEPPQ